MRERLGFDIEVSHNGHLPPGARELHAVLSVTASPLPDTGDTELPPPAEVIMFDCSAAGPGMINHIKRGVMAAIDALPDGVEFAVIAGRGGARMVFPVGRQLCPSSPENRAVAKAAVSVVTPSTGSTTLRDWISLADQLFVEHPGTVRHALLVTASDSGEDVRELEKTADSCAGHFVCDCVGVGEGGDIGGLRAIAARLGGSVELVADPARLSTNLVSAVTGVLAKSVTDTALRLWLPKGVRVRFLEQVFPVRDDLTERRGKLGYRTDAWGAERRDYHLCVDLEPGDVGQSMIATRARLVRPAALGEPGELVPLAAGLVTATWTDDVARTLPLDPRVAKVLGKAELAEAVHAAMTARGEGNSVAANEQFSEAVRHAAEANDAETLSQLDRVVESDPVTGAVRLREQPAANGTSVLPKPPKPVRRRRAVVAAIESAAPAPSSPRPRGRHRRDDEVLDDPSPEPTGAEPAVAQPFAPEQPPADQSAPEPAEPFAADLPMTFLPPSLEPEGFDLAPVPDPSTVDDAGAAPVQEPVRTAAPRPVAAREPEPTPEARPRPEPPRQPLPAEPVPVPLPVSLPEPVAEPEPTPQPVSTPEPAAEPTRQPLPVSLPEPVAAPGDAEEPAPGDAPASRRAAASWGGWPTLPAAPNGRAPRPDSNGHATRREAPPVVLPTIALTRQPAAASETTVIKRGGKRRLPTGETPRIKPARPAPEPLPTTVLRREDPPTSIALTPVAARKPDAPPEPPTAIAGAPAAVTGTDAPANGSGSFPRPVAVAQPAPAPPQGTPSQPAIPRPAVPQHSAPQPVPPTGALRSGPWPAPHPPAAVRAGFALATDPRKDLDPGRGVPGAQNFWFWVEIPATAPVPGAEDAVLTVSLFEFPGEFAIKQDAALGQIRLGADGSSSVLRQPSIVQDGARLCFPVTTPYTLGPARLRCNVYWRQTLVQSLLVEVHVTDKPTARPGSITTTVDYRLTDPAETLGMPQVPEHSASLMLTGDGRGSQSVRLLTSDGRQPLRAETSLGEHQLAEEIRLARGALNRVAWASAEPWREGLEYRYAQPPTVEQFTLDLGLLATHGRRLHQLLMSGVPEHVGAALAKPGFVQIPLTASARHVLPTAMIYDLPLDLGSPVLRLCADFLGAVQRGTLYGSPCFLRTCGHARHPDPTTVCPGGFWGFRHALGLPVSLGPGPAQPPTLPSDGGVRLAGGLHRGFPSADEHSAALRRMLPWRGFQLAEDRAGALSELEGDPQVVYFYAHGGVDGDTPFLRVGTEGDEPITAASLRQRRLRWERSRPLVFLNTSKVTGPMPMGLVSYFVAEAMASGVIGTETTVFEELADEFGQEVLRSFLINRDAIGVAVMRARISLLAKGNPLGLAYVPFVSPAIGLAER
ncbi:hypothetical protein [Allokutzneria oryzae]|uniref:VWFA domain-containing protein n=1 Tax=Allokutzneria oryzae TaxID=1378989 RepID=A0ABV6A6N7_9PSEU